MGDRAESVRVRSLARCLISTYGKGAQGVALAVAATLLAQGQIDYAELWQQAAQFIGALLS